MAEWQNGGMAEWQNGRMAHQLSHGLVEWSESGRHALIQLRQQQPHVRVQKPEKEKNIFQVQKQFQVQTQV